MRFYPTIYLFNAGDAGPFSKLREWLQKRYQNIFQVKPLCSEQDLPVDLTFHEGDVAVVVLRDGNFPFSTNPIWGKLRDWLNEIDRDNDLYPLIVVKLLEDSAPLGRIVDDVFTTEIRNTPWSTYKPNQYGDLFDQIRKRLGFIHKITGTKVFISYSRSDGSPLARTINDFLRNKEVDSNFDTYLDQDDVTEPRSRIWEDTIRPKLKSSGCLLLLDTEGAAESIRNKPFDAWVKREYDFALRHQIPLLLIVWRKPKERPQTTRIRDLIQWPGDTIHGDGATPSISETELADLLIRIDQLLLHDFKDHLFIYQSAIKQFQREAYESEIRSRHPMHMHSEKTTNLPGVMKRVHSRISVRTPIPDQEIGEFVTYSKKRRKQIYNANFLIHQDKEISEANIHALKTRYKTRHIDRILHYALTYDQLLTI
jgi:hypothetical protein